MKEITGGYRIAVKLPKGEFKSLHATLLILTRE